MRAPRVGCKYTPLLMTANVRIPFRFVNSYSVLQQWHSMNRTDEIGWSQSQLLLIPWKSVERKSDYCQPIDIIPRCRRIWFVSHTFVCYWPPCAQHRVHGFCMWPIVPQSVAESKLADAADLRWVYSDRTLPDPTGIEHNRVVIWATLN